jgi:hypothetical protein
MCPDEPRFGTASRWHRAKYPQEQSLLCLITAARALSQTADSIFRFNVTKTAAQLHSTEDRILKMNVKNCRTGPCGKIALGPQFPVRYLWFFAWVAELADAPD